MKIVQINTTCGLGSTGRICVSISKLLSENGIENYVFYTDKDSDYSRGIKLSGRGYKKFQTLKSRIFGNYGFNSVHATRVLIKQLECISPDIVHLHNIHGHDIQLGMLLEYCKEKKLKVVWTFHDCWAFTAYCPHFDMIGCDQWKSECKKCPLIKEVSWVFDRSSVMFNRKKKAAEGLDLTVVTPSLWLAEKVNQSFLKNCHVKVINNGIDLDAFKPTGGDFREKNGLTQKKIVLGVAFGWGKKKGLDVFIDLSRQLSDEYRIVLVGTNNEIDKQLPSNIVSVHRTRDKKELAEIYTAADVFVNPTREENYPTVNMEALACGTPVVTFNTGGSSEIIDSTCGICVEKDDVERLKSEIISVCEGRKYDKDSCLRRAESFDENERFKEYLSLYGEIINE